MWAIPVATVALLTGTGSTLTTQGLFFSWTALVTFGGAYAVLAYVAQRAVETYGWLSPGEMVRGLALAETTPGPSPWSSSSSPSSGPTTTPTPSPPGPPPWSGRW